MNVGSSTVNVSLKGDEWNRDVPRQIACTYDHTTTVQGLLEQIAKQADHNPENLTLASSYNVKTNNFSMRTTYGSSQKVESVVPYSSQSWGSSYDHEVAKTSLVADILKPKEKETDKQEKGYGNSSSVTYSTTEYSQIFLSVFVNEGVKRTKRYLTVAFLPKAWTMEVTNKIVTLADVQKEILDREGIPFENQRMVVKLKDVSDQAFKTLNELGLEDGAVVHCVRKKASVVTSDAGDKKSS